VRERGRLRPPFLLRAVMNVTALAPHAFDPKLRSAPFPAHRELGHKRVVFHRKIVPLNSFWDAFADLCGQFSDIDQESKRALMVCPHMLKDAALTIKKYIATVCTEPPQGGREVIR
jgi:hypothetical protein